MASIKKLSIRGIRSFSHERDQVIEFYTPLTMIVGANGCGKTTIIECLKYACTGALPPGARNGQSFVHDPKVSGTNEVKANIKLRFSTRDRTVSVVIRSFQLTQKRKTLQFKALDGVIRTKGENGQSVSINHKCTEMDKHIPLRLGVSKAILENVVFCHQEDASWPLQEGAVVKKKFDDIFESARYTKALDTIKKTKQEYASLVKDLKVDLAGLQERLRAAQSLKGELETSTEAYSSIRKEIETLDARNNELSESLEKLRAVADEVGMLEGRKQSLQLTCRDLEVRMGEKRENIGDGGDLSAASDENLRKELEEFDAKLAACADEIRFYSDEADRCAQRANAAKKQKDRLQGEQGSLQAQLSQQERVVAGRDGMMESLSKRYDIFNPAPSAAAAGSEAAGSRYTSDDVSSFEEALRAAMDKAQVTFNEVRAKTRAEEDSMNAELNTLKIEQQSSADAVEAKERELRKIQNDAMSLAGSASGVPGSQSQLGMATVSKLKRELEAAEKAKEQAIKDSDDFFKNDKTQEVAREIKELEGRLSQIRVGVEEEEANVKALSSQQHEQSQIQVKTAQIEDDEGRLDERVREGPAFNNSFVSSPPQEVSQAALGSVLTELKMASSKLEGERVDKAREVMSLHREVAQNNTNLVNTKRDKSRVALQLDDLSSAVKVVRESMEGVPNPSPGEALDAEKHFDWILDHYVKKEKRMSKSASIVKFAEMYAESVLLHAEQEHSCLTCQRLLTDEEHEELKRIQADQIEKGKADAQAKQNGMGSSHAECKATIKRLKDVGDTWKQRLRLSSRPPELAEEQARLEQEGAEKKQELEREEQEEKRLLASRQKVDEDLREVERCLEEAIRIDGVRIEVDQIKEKLQRYNQNKGTLGEAQERLRELTTDKDKVITDIQAKTKKLTSIGNRKYEVTTARNMREADYDKAFSNLEAKKEFDKKREILRERERSLEGEVKDLKAKEQPLRQQLQEKTKQQARAKEKGRAAQDRLQTTFQECQQDVKAFSRSQREVAAGMAKNLPETLKSIQARLQEVESTVKENEEATRENERTMSGKVLMSDKQEQHKKVLKDNIDYRALKSKLREQQKEVAQVEKEISETDSEDFRGKMDQINGERNKNVQRRAELKGRLHGMKDQIHGFQAKLESDPYRNVEEKHRRKMIEHRTTEMAVTDLDKYWTALDKALLRFHTMKIADINKIIRELWAMTYSGEDIDMIEIVSGDDEDAGKAKRSYNYRVVMRKNDATLDMKGRCSAGQRVLASVVIRLALAETFCVSCGILALDEPTTNLDHNNKVGLAHALAKIISSRSKQSNFQLITITHDEEFVQTMRTELGTQGGFSMPEFYWRISREEISRGKFYSRIDRLDWEDM